VLNYVPLADTEGRPIHPGDRVVLRLAPRGSVRGVVRLSSRPREMRDEGDYTWYLDLLTYDGTLYELPDDAVLLRR